MSRHYLLLAKIGKRLRFFSLRSNAHPKRVKQEAYWMLKARYGNQMIEFLFASDFPVWAPDLSETKRERHLGKAC
ncbi:MAG: hypothetical protein HY644_03930 [Acidobacteria bacterium]|nr:hypothetical protein [Acidobacteriota bacterium]